MSRLPAELRTRLLPIALAQAVGLFCGLAGVKLVSQLVSPADYGRYGVFLTFTPLGMWVVHAGLVAFMLRHWAEETNRPGLWRRVARAALRKLPWLVLAATGAAAVMAGPRWWQVLPFVLVSAAALSCGALAQACLQAERRHWSDLLVSTGGSITRTFLPPLLYVLGGGTVMMLYGGLTLHALFFGALAWWVLRPGWPRRPKPAAAETPLAGVYDGPMFSLLAVAGWVLTGLNRWLVALFFGAATAGYFTLANNIAMIVPAVLGTMLTQYFQPDFFARPSNSEAERRQLARGVDRVALLFWMAALGGILALRLAIPWLTGTLIDLRYEAAVDFIVPAGCFFVATITGQFYHMLLLAGKRERSCAPVNLVFAASLTLGGIGAAALGRTVFNVWLMMTPALPWLLFRPMARHYFFKPAAGAAPARAP